MNIPQLNLPNIDQRRSSTPGISRKPLIKSAHYSFRNTPVDLVLPPTDIGRPHFKTDKISKSVVDFCRNNDVKIHPKYVNSFTEFMGWLHCDIPEKRLESIVKNTLKIWVIDDILDDKKDINLFNILCEKIIDVFESGGYSNDSNLSPHHLNLLNSSIAPFLELKYMMTDNQLEYFKFSFEMYQRDAVKLHKYIDDGGSDPEFYLDLKIYAGCVPHFICMSLIGQWVDVDFSDKEVKEKIRLASQLVVLDNDGFSLKKELESEQYESYHVLSCLDDFKASGEIDFRHGDIKREVLMHKYLKLKTSCRKLDGVCDRWISCNVFYSGGHNGFSPSIRYN